MKAKCPTGKVKHHYRLQAAAHLQSLRKDKSYKGQVYECPACGGYHVGRKPTRNRGTHVNKYK